MRKLIMVSMLILCLTLNICVSANAESDSNGVSYDAATGLLTVSGKAEENALVTLVLLKYGVMFDDTNKTVDSSDVLFFDTIAATDGKYEFNVEFQGSSGTYYASIVNSNDGERSTLEIVMVDPDTYPIAISALNTAAAGDFTAVFKPAFETYKDDLGFNYELSISDEALEMLQTHIAENNMTVTEYEKNLKLYQTFCVIGALNEESLSTIDTHLNYIYFEDEKLKTDFESIADVSGAAAAATTKMSGENITSLSDFYNKFIDGMVLGATDYSSGVNRLMSLLSSYKIEIGITKNITFAATSGINGKTYENIDALVNAYNNYYNGANSNYGSGGGNGGSGGITSNSGSSIGSVSLGIRGENASVTKPEPVIGTYNDIEGYKWATTAIIALTDLGIVNGKDDGIFAPEDNLLREEFAKILVCALKEKTATANVFADVASDAWYCGWVNRASELGICQGSGDGVFGTGNNITREDMCVMIVNALRYKNNNYLPVELNFADADSISDYAKEAVGVLYGMGAINGVSETSFAPQEYANRAQAAKIVYYVLEYLQ